jgi:hypothetical protein
MVNPAWLWMAHILRIDVDAHVQSEVDKLIVEMENGYTSE